MIQSLLEHVGELPGALLYLVAFLLALGESAALVDLVVPGEVGLVLVSAAAAEGKANPVVLVVLVAAGAVIGDSAGYWIGHAYGRRAVQRFDVVRRHLEPRLDRAERHFEERGGVMVFVSRWVGALRAVMPLVAGSAKMPYRRFLAWDVPSAVIWAPAIVAAGWYGGRPAARVVDRFSLALALAAVAVALGWLAVRRFRHRRGRAGAGLASSVG